jgi:hypothetical protein
MWVGNRCYPPERLSAALESLFGEPVAHIKVVQYSIYVRFHWRAIATTRRNSHLPARQRQGILRRRPAVLHEYFHVLRSGPPET